MMKEVSRCGCISPMGCTFHCGIINPETQRVDLNLLLVQDG